jgi:hypothetical protein
MNRVHSLRFEALESRELLSRTHTAIAHDAKAHAKPAAADAAPLVLSGTLTVNSRAASTSENAYGDYTESEPVSGQLSGLGKVHGIWYESTDSEGDYEGPDTITLHSAKGGFTIAFNNGTSGPAHSTGNDTVYYQHAQEVISASGAYTRAKESGTIDLNMNAAHTTVESVTLSSSGT